MIYILACFFSLLSLFLVYYLYIKPRQLLRFYKTQF